MTKAGVVVIAVVVGLAEEVAVEVTARVVSSSRRCQHTSLTVEVLLVLVVVVASW
jgi:FlaG/FlaF family flagellin (archaellin)